MNISRLSKTVVISAVLAALSSLEAATVDEIIAKARAQLAPESVLKAVRTIEYRGKVFDADGKESGEIILDFMKPEMQRLVLNSSTAKETTAVSEYEGWRERFNKEQPELSGIEVLMPMQVLYLQANARENLNFFRGPDSVKGATVTLGEDKNIDGRDCWELRYSYPSGLRYNRYFDKATGELVATESGDTGHRMVEKGRIDAGGIRFPKEVHTYHNGELVRYVVFDEIKVNGDMNSTIFDFPLLPTPASLKQGQ